MFVIRREFDESDEKKDITLRGVNKELYESFTTQAKKHGLSTGDAVNNILLLADHPWRIHHFRRHAKQPRFGITPEKVIDLEKLVVSKKDLTAAGEKTIYLFRNIKELVFEKDVDAAILVKHVKLISSSNVKFLSDIPKLIQLGIIRRRKEYNHPTDKDLLKDVTIRNVSSKLYSNFVSQAKTEGKTTGQFFSNILANVLPAFEISDAVSSLGEREVLVVTLEDELFISKQDLEVLGDRGVILYGINKLEFAKDINQELFLKTIVKIIKCDKVTLPTNIPRLIVLSRAIGCKETNITY